MTSIRKRTIGRPRKHFEKRSNFTFRIAPQTRVVLGERAEAAGRSMSEEVELILEKVIFPISIAPNSEEDAA